MLRQIIFLSFLVMSVVLASAAGILSCGGGGGGQCKVAEQTGCDEGLVCERTTEGEVGCFLPLTVRGSVFDLADDSAIEGARVVARDANGSPISNVAVTDANGNYELTVLTTRNEDGSPAGDDFTLRADAAGYQTFPGGVRQALPIDTSSPTEEEEEFVIDTVQTDIGLIAFEVVPGTGAIYGTVDLPDENLGALVVAETNPAFSAIADREGDYKIFNLPADDYTVRAYVQGVNYDPEAVTLSSGEEAEVNLNQNGDDTSTLTGSVQLVNPEQGTGTSVILVVKSTFDYVLKRGEFVPGLRAPGPGIDPNIKGSFTIEGIPTGEYVILAAFENDFLVRDPDTCIAGTDILEQAFGSGDDIERTDGFKVTGSLDVLEPPASVSTTTPTLSWVDDSSEKSYAITVFDTFGNIVWETVIDGVSSGNPSVIYDVDGDGAGTATPLESGMFYQFRATSFSNLNCELSRTEDLQGVFFVE